MHPPFCCWGGGESSRLILSEHLQGLVPQDSQLPVYRVLPRQERQYGRPPLDQPVHGNRQAHVSPRKFQTGLQGFHCLFPPSRCCVHFRQIQVELCLVPLHPHGRIAQPFCFAPFLFRARQHHSQIRHVVRIVFVEVYRALHMRQRFHRIVVSQQR